MRLLECLQQWFQAQCDEDWEHGYGVEIATMSNPGWSLQIDLTGTILEEKSFSGLEYGCDEGGHDWMRCKVEEAQFTGNGGPTKLPELIQTFLNWAKTEQNWLAVPPYQSARELDLEWYRNLSEETGPELCRREGCGVARIAQSVFCRRHQFEQVKGYLPTE
ncbi:MAG: hypothetical protein GXP29_06645 [Planctomycetes bacterium]|nr:hypothetical protein [Planctomycetota bacterium]